MPPTSRYGARVEGSRSGSRFLSAPSPTAVRCSCCLGSPRPSNGRFAWGPDEPTACLRSQLVERDDPLRSRRESEADAFRAVLGDVFSPWRRHTESEARALRAIGWRHDTGCAMRTSAS